MSDITYGKANSLCVDQLAQLRCNMLEEFEEISLRDNKEKFIIHCRTIMQKYIESDRWICFIAQENTTIIGNVWLERVDKIPLKNQTGTGDM